MATDLPKTMAGVVIEKNGGVDVLQYRTDLPVPVPKEGEVLVKNEFMGVNYIDTYFRSGLYPAPSFPYMLGREGGGKVISLGPSPSSPSSTTSLPALSPGDSVAYMGMSAYAEYVAVPSLYVYRLPAGVSTETGAAGILQGLTALTMIREAYPAKAGDWVLVHAAAGGTGQWLCRLLKATGVRVIGTASSEAKREVARKAGAEIVLPSFNHDDGGASEEEFVKEVERITGGKGCDAVLDGVGKDTFESSMQVVKRKGWLISFGNASGAVPPFPISRLSPKNIRLMRPMLFPFIQTREEVDHFAGELFDLIASGKVEVPVHDKYPLKDIARAHSDLEGRKTTGKLIITP